MVDVVAVEVEVDVRGTVGIMLVVVEELVVRDMEELLEDAVTVGSIVEITVVPTTPVHVES